VCTENLNPDVLMMKSAQDGARPKAKCVRVSFIVASVRFQNPAQMCLAQNNGAVHTFTPDRSDQPFDKAILLG
jgi:hypothetical protein